MVYFIQSSQKTHHSLRHKESQSFITSHYRDYTLINEFYYCIAMLTISQRDGYGDMSYNMLKLMKL